MRHLSDGQRTGIMSGSAMKYDGQVTTQHLILFSWGWDMSKSVFFLEWLIQIVTETDGGGAQGHVLTEQDLCWKRKNSNQTVMLIHYRDSGCHALKQDWV